MFGFCSLLFACSGDTTGTAPLSLYGGILLNQHAINMSVAAPANTIQLTATLLDAHGVPLPADSQDAVHATFFTTDSSVSVTDAGLVTAHYVTAATSYTQQSAPRIIAAVQRGNTTYTDTAFVRVTATAPAQLATFALQPPDPVVGFGAVGDNFYPTILSTNVAGAAVPFDVQSGRDNIYWLATSRSTIATPGARRTLSNNYELNDTGHVTLYATSWVYGVAVQDSIESVVNFPSQVILYLSNCFTAGWAARCATFVPAGGVVIWIYQVTPGDTTTLVFDHPAAADSVDPGFGFSGSGNLHFDESSFFQARQFPTVGTYRYHLQSNPSLSGVVFVTSNSQ